MMNESRQCNKCDGEVTLQEGDNRGYCQEGFHLFTLEEFLSLRLFCEKENQ